MIQLTQKKLSTINPDILLVYGNLKPETNKEYFELKTNTILQKKLPGAPPISIENNKLKAEIKVAQPEEVPNIPTELDVNINCLKKNILNEYPLLLNEVIINDRITFLLEKFHNLPKRTIVYELTTNKTSLYFLLKNISLDNEYNLVLQDSSFTLPPKLHSNLDSLSLKLNVKSVAVFMGKGIASGMLSAVGGAIANAIIEAIFPPEIPEYFDEVYAQITKVVKQEIQKSKIDSISGAITNLIQKINYEYVPALKQRDLKSKEDREHLFNLLQKYDQTFLSGAEGMLGTLQQKDKASAGFTVFMLGATLQLSIYQEMANVDPMNKNAKEEWKNPNESSYGKPKSGTLAKTAESFIKHAKKTYDSIMKASDNAVKAEKYMTERAYVIGQTLVTDRTYYCRIKDNGVATNKVWEIGQDDKHGNNPKFDQFVKQEVPSYKEQKRRNLDNEMNHPIEVIENWKSLINSPIKL
ncbi:hypothetical protein MK851_04040 [Tenacibaculum sp. 1B UA]|uniref:hypothetical protein n=1 Tax=unclassified Tenacibaculum TaxID=2635139 RepID=UPI0026E1E46C|nr:MULTISPECIES: hypothetical protein [unclassified Tenacibaculum]MDO6676074.1 hypothetical protein [Tenacibaculum sp. 1_MG-2023]MDX8552795.1 hypothetical protein [Tenacibaculum sp. 1B UA]